MNETASWFGDCRVKRFSSSEARSKEAIIVYRGFPGEAPPAHADLYAHLVARPTISATMHRETGADVFVPQYEGLGGSRGRFTFMGSVLRGIAFALETAACYERTHVVGYSWGGLVGFNAHRAIGGRGGRLALISALSDLGDDAFIRRFLSSYVRDYPHLFEGERALETAAADLGAVRDRFNPASLSEPGPDAFLIHGSKDSDVSPDMTRRLAGRLDVRPVELDDDHAYESSWAKMLAAVACFLKNGERRPD